MSTVDTVTRLSAGHGAGELPILRVERRDIHTDSGTIELPDDGEAVTRLAMQAAGGAFDPRRLEDIEPALLGYRGKWLEERYPYYGLEWDITALRLESGGEEAVGLPWLVVVHGGSANFYEFFIRPDNGPGLGQYLAQRANVLLVTIPGNYKPEGWAVPVEERQPEYLLRTELSRQEAGVRNAIYTNRLVLEGLRRLIMAHTEGSVLVVGHSTAGELAFLAARDPDLGPRLQGRFLGWGSGGPANLRRSWEAGSQRRRRKVEELRQYFPLGRLRVRTAQEYADSGYVGPRHPCRERRFDAASTARQWVAREERRRPNFKQPLQDIEHSGAQELRGQVEGGIERAVAGAEWKIDPAVVCADLFSSEHTQPSDFRRMAWVVGALDRGHWNRADEEQSRELTVAQSFRRLNPDAAVRVVLIEEPLTHYGHFEMPAELAGVLLHTARWVAHGDGAC